MTNLTRTDMHEAYDAQDWDGFLAAVERAKLWIRENGCGADLAFRAVREDHPEMLEALLAAGLNPNIRCPNMALTLRQFTQTRGNQTCIRVINRYQTGEQAC